MVPGECENQGHRAALESASRPVKVHPIVGREPLFPGLGKASVEAHAADVSAGWQYEWRCSQLHLVVCAVGQHRYKGFHSYMFLLLKTVVSVFFPVKFLDKEMV